MATVKTFIGNVKGIPGKDGSENQIYSTDEQVIGKWIDGKPIYRKVVNKSIIKPGDTLISLNVDKLINASGYFQWNGAIQVLYKFPCNDNDVTVGVGVDSNKICVNTNYTDNSLINLHAILEYTKTTD